MKSKHIKIASTIVLTMLFAGIVAHGFGFGSVGGSSQAQPKTVSQATPVPLNLQVQLTADGATFPQLLISNYISNYQLAHPNVTITYTGTGSGKGQRDTMNKTVDFAASDAPLSAAQRLLTPNILHIPETIGSVTAAYNLPGIKTGQLNLNDSTIANIYLNVIKMWNDTAIQQQNPGLTLPQQPIHVVYRGDSSGSGTSFVWTSFLSSCSDSPCVTWRTTPGLGPSTAPAGYPWPTGTGATGNPGVANFVNSTLYTIGYVELAYVITHSLTVANIKNPAGNYIFPTEASTASAVADSSSNLPSAAASWAAVSLLNAPGANDYPIASFSYFLVYKELNVVPTMNMADNVQAAVLKDFLNYCVTTGQSFGPSLGFVPLPSTVVSISQAGISSITFTHISTPTTTTVNLSASATAWSIPSLTVTTGDTVNFNLLSTNGANHQFYIDFDNNGVLDSNENWTTVSPVFSSSTTATPWTFKPVIWNQEGIPAAGTYTFRDSQNAALTGTITVQPQQVAAVFKPHSSLTSGLAPVLDSSRVTVLGSGLVDMRTHLLSGNLTNIAVDKTSGSVTYVKSYIIPAIKMSVTGTTATVNFLLNAAVSPYALSSNLQVSLNGFTAITASSVSRNLDFAGRGTVDIVDVSGFAFHFDSVLGQPNYLAQCDENADGKIDIIDISTAALFFDDLAFS